MTQQEFVAVIKQVAFDPAVSDKALQPAGRKPHQSSSGCGTGTPACPARDKAMVQHAMRIAAYGAVFHFFAALDGSAVIDDPPHGQLRLTYLSPDGSEVPLNITDQVSLPDVDELHALWTGEVFPYTEPLPT
jgi:hypothetical protein